MTADFADVLNRRRLAIGDFLLTGGPGRYHVERVLEGLPVGAQRQIVATHGVRLFAVEAVRRCARHAASAAWSVGEDGRLSRL